jgi:hypothetical protein
VIPRKAHPANDHEQQSERGDGRDEQRRPDLAPRRGRAPERRRTRSTPAAVRISDPAHAVKPADHPSTDALNGPTLTPYQGRKAAMKATAAPATITRSRVLRRFQSNRIFRTSRTSA